MKRFGKAVFCGTLTAILALGTLAGCGKVDGKQEALAVNGKSITVGEANFYLRYQQAETTTMMEIYGLGTAGSMFGTDDTNEESYAYSFKSDVRDSLVKIMLHNEHAEEYGVVLSEDEIAKADEAAKATYEANKAVMDDQGITADNIAAVLKSQKIQKMMYDPMVADVDTNVTTEEASQRTVTYGRVSITDVEDAKKAELKGQMEEWLKNVKQAGGPDQVDYNVIGQLINEDFYSGTYSYGKDDDTLPTEVQTAADTLKKDGDFYDGIIEVPGQWLYFVRLDKAFDEEATESAKVTIANERQQTAYDAKVQEWVDTADVQVKKGWENLKVTDKVIFTDPSLNNTGE